MSLSDEQIRHIAKLAALALSEEDFAWIGKDINNILEHVNLLTEVSTRGVVPTSHVHGVVNAFREDVTKDSLTLDEVKQNAPDFSFGAFTVPRVI